MLNFILILGLLSTACGVFVVGFGIPIRETTFGSALLVAGAVVIAGGFVTIGLAAAIAELRRVLGALKARTPAMPRPLRPVERKDGNEKRPGPPRMPFPGRPQPEMPAADWAVPTQPIQQVPPTPNFPEAARTQPANPFIMRAGPSRPGAGHTERRDEPSSVPHPPGTPPSLPHPSSPEWLHRAFAEISAAQPATAGGSNRRQDDPRSADDWPRASPPPPPAANFSHPSEAESSDRRDRGSGGETNMFDAVWPSTRRHPVEVVPIPEKRDEERREPAQSRRPAEPVPRPAESAPTAKATAPPAPPAFPPPPPTPPPPPPPSILKSGVIDEMAYTLFTDGSIEAQMPDGTMRFASIEELRRHLDRQGG